MALKPTVTIGIPAYNEEANIRQLLLQLLNQKQRTFILEEILIVSDASKDRTCEEVKRVTDSRVRLIAGRSRQGQAMRQNLIFEQATSDIVVLLNADILPKNKFFLEEIVKPFKRKGFSGLVGAKVEPTRASTNFGRMLDWHMGWKNQLYEQINHADSIYLCHGRARAFSRDLYKQLRWPPLWSEDAYSYLRTKELGFGFCYSPKAVILYQSPESVADHIRQSLRFLRNTDSLSQAFATHKLDKYLAIPKPLLLRHTVSGFLNRPIYAFWYSLVFGYTSLLKYVPQLSTALARHNWEPSTSTKLVKV